MAASKYKPRISFSPGIKMINVVANALQQKKIMGKWMGDLNHLLLWLASEATKTMIWKRKRIILRRLMHSQFQWMGWSQIVRNFNEGRNSKNLQMKWWNDKVVHKWRQRNYCKFHSNWSPVNKGTLKAPQPSTLSKGPRLASVKEWGLYICFLCNVDKCSKKRFLWSNFPYEWRWLVPSVSWWHSL